jgi:hypothetical protein
MQDGRKDKSIFLVHGRHEAARDQLAIFLNSLKLDVISWREARELTGLTTPTTLDIVERGIESAQCVVVLLTGDDLAKLRPHFGEEEERLQPRPNVIFEAGWALATAGAARTLLVVLDSVNLMSDIQGLNYVKLDNTPASRRDFVSRLRTAGCEPEISGDEWLDPNSGGDFKISLADINITELRPEEDGNFSKQQMGGLFTPYVIDSALALELSHSALFRQMADAIRKGDPLDLKFHYVGTRMAEYWMDVCKEDSYGHDFLTRVTARAIEPIVDAMELEGKINLASLGAGDGQADIVFLDHLQRHLDLDMYLPVDISLDLLQTAVAEVMKAPALRTDDRNFRMKPVLADFELNLTSIEPFLTYDNTPNFYFLTGYTLGNAPEQAVIESLHRTMRPQDLLLVDARLHDAGEITDDRQLTKDLEDRLKAPYSSPAVQKFAFGPVQIASDFAVNHEDIEFSHEIHVGRTTSVPHGIDVTLMCKGLEKSEAFKESPLGENGGWLQRLRPRALQLAAVTYYDFEALGKWFANRGFKVAWQQKEGDVGLYAMRVNGHQPG